MHLIIYCSKSCLPKRSFKREFHNICVHAMAENKARSVTGLLMYHVGWFVQVLEGEKSVFRELEATISTDLRYQQYQRLIDTETAERSFADWSIGGLELDDSVVIEPNLLGEFSRIYRNSSDINAKELLDMMAMFLENSHCIERLV